MVTLVPFVRNWKALNIFRPVEKRRERNALGEINLEPKCFVYVSFDNYFSYDIEAKVPKLEEF